MTPTHNHRSFNSKRIQFSLFLRFTAQKLKHRKTETETEIQFLFEPKIEQNRDIKTEKLSHVSRLTDTIQLSDLNHRSKIGPRFFEKLTFGAYIS